MAPFFICGDKSLKNGAGFFNYPLILFSLSFSRGAIAQLGERLHGMQEVVGSIPISSTISL